MTRLVSVLYLWGIAINFFIAIPVHAASTFILIPGGAYMPFFSTSLKPTSTKQGMQNTDEIYVVKKPVVIKNFFLDNHAVTEEDFLKFVIRYPEWRKSRIPSLFADRSYLATWPDDVSFGTPNHANEPVTSVSWFAAQAYCEAQGKRLPTTDEWEYALADQGRNKDGLMKTALAWLAEPSGGDMKSVGLDPPNGYGVHDLIGLIWEWTDDFDSFLTTGELRSPDNKSTTGFCGSGGLGANDTRDYPAFMRYSMRASLKPNYTVRNIGFRCAGDVP